MTKEIVLINLKYFQNFLPADKYVAIATSFNHSNQFY